jgi:FtsZ-interacting cell division protein ZipA
MLETNSSGKGKGDGMAEFIFIAGAAVLIWWW